MEGLVLNEEKHEYTFKGVVVPGITSILSFLKLSKDFSQVDPFYAQRGIALHKAAELYLKGILDESTIDASYRGHFEGFKAWWQKQHSTKKLTELSLYSTRLNYAGTLDLVLDDGIWDYKCSKDPDPAAELQGAGQQMLYGELSGSLLPFKVLQLPGDGTYKEIDYRPTSPNLWDGVMEVYNWVKKAHPRRK